MLSERDQELVAVGASIAAGCRPCTTYHFQAARLAGASEEQLRQAMSDALSVRQSATQIMTSLGAVQLGDARTMKETCETKSLLSELVAVAAAYAVNCAANLETHAAAARQQGATNGQLLTALKIADAIKNTAESKAQAAAAQALGRAADSNEPCGCQGESTTSEAEQTAATAQCSGDRTEPCGCSN
jgi:AhpD family alkylhydroperoxidase